MIELKDLLLKFSNLLLSKEAKRGVVQKVVSGVLGVEIKPEEIEIKGDTVYLKIKPIYKNEVLLKRELIFSKLNASVGGWAPKEIR